MEFQQDPRIDLQNNLGEQKSITTPSIRLGALPLMIFLQVFQLQLE